MNEDKSRQRLGRGLASLIGAGVASPARAANGFAPTLVEASGERMLALSRIAANPRNPRRHFDEADLADLTSSIKTHGVVQPILVRSKVVGAAEFEIVAGERRWRAAQAAGLAEVPVVVREISDRESLEIAIIENVQRSDLSAIEEAEAYQLLIEEHGYTQADLADVLGKSRSHVANTLRLLKLPEAVRAMVSTGDLSPGHARTAVSAEDPLAFAQAIVDRGLSVREAEEMARAGSAPVAEMAGERASAKGAGKRGRLPASTGSVQAVPAADAEPRPTAESGSENDGDTRALERLLSEALGMPVEIRLPERGGDIRIAYGTLESLDELCRLLQTRQQSRGAEPRVRSL